MHSMMRLNLVKGLGPVLQIAEGWTVEIDPEIHQALNVRTDKTWPTTWFVPRLTDKSPFKDVYSVMNNWGANHGAISYGHIGKDLITLASILRIPVCMLNQTHRMGDLATEKFNGYYAEVACMLFGGEQKYVASKGAFTQPSCGKEWGDIEVAARFDRLDMNGTNVKGGQSNGYTLGVNYYASKNLKFQLNYSYVDHEPAISICQYRDFLQSLWLVHQCCDIRPTFHA